MADDRWLPEQVWGKIKREKVLKDVAEEPEEEVLYPDLVVKDGRRIRLKREEDAPHEDETVGEYITRTLRQQMNDVMDQQFRDNVFFNGQMDRDNDGGYEQPYVVYKDIPDVEVVIEVNPFEFTEGMRRAQDSIDALKYAMESRIGFSMHKRHHDPFIKKDQGS